MSVFLNDAEKFGLDERLILDCFGEPDDWESVCGIVYDGTGSKVVRAPSLFPYISTAWPNLVYSSTLHISLLWRPLTCHDICVDFDALYGWLLRYWSTSDLSSHWEHPYSHGKHSQSRQFSFWYTGSLVHPTAYCSSDQRSFPILQVTFSAPSFASMPEFEKKTWSSLGASVGSWPGAKPSPPLRCVVATRRDGNWMTFVVIHIARMDDFRGLSVYNLQALRHQSVPLDNIHTFTTPSSACPNESTAMSALKSSVSQLYDTFPCEMTNSGRA